MERNKTDKGTVSRLRRNNRKKRNKQKKKSSAQINESKSLHIPQEIIENILSRLPLKSLLRFKIVCKAWRSTISESDFRKPGESESVFVAVDSRKGLFPYSIDKKGDMAAFPAPWCKQRYVKYGCDRVYVSNSCNGMVLICLGISFFLFNPSTRYFFKVLTQDRLSDEGYSMCMGLCYDESISDYKAVMLLSHESPDYGGKFVLQAALKGKRWTEVSFPFKFYARGGPYVKGRLHWVVLDSDNHDDGRYFHEGKKIIRFDPVLNVFDVLPSPPPKSGVENAIVGLGVVEECLWMTRCINNENDFRGDVEVLKMKEYGVAESWTTMFVLSNIEVNRYFGILNPLLMTKDGEVLFLQWDEIWAYNIARKLYWKYFMPKKGNCIHSVSLQNLASPLQYDTCENDDWN